MSLSKVASTSRPEVIELISQVERDVVTMGVDLTALPQILDRLTDLYPRPIEASVREVISNAYDATVLLPESERKPIEVSTPTALNPMFVVKDFGVGMSLATVKNVYAQYGASTKKTDFSQIGAYGLGAKAPLSYCTEFYGETTHEGITTSFKVSREKTGNFTTILDSKLTGKPNGTTISIPAKTQDAGKFQAAIKVYENYGVDISLQVDGRLVLPTGFILINEALVLDEDSDTRGRVWVRKEKFADALLTMLIGRDPLFVYSLSGWRYDAKYDPYNREDAMVLVELKPGIVEFSSSRDEITQNERLEKLNKLVMAARETHLEAMLKLYRALPNDAAYNAFKRIATHNSVTFDEKKNSITISKQNYRQQAPAKTIKLDNFITASGYDPSVFLFPKQTKNITGAFILNSQNTKLVGFQLEDTQNYYGGTYYGQYIREMYIDNTVALMEKHEKNPQRSLSWLASYMEFNNEIKYHRVTDGPNSDWAMIVVSDIPEKKHKLALSWRKALANEGGYSSSLYVFAKDSAEVKKQLAFISAHSTVKIKHYTFEELRLEVKNIRAKAAKPKEDTTVEVEAFPFDYFSSKNRRFFGQYTTIDLNELITTKDYLIVADTQKDNLSHIIKGVQNEGVALTGKNIYVVKNLRASHIELLRKWGRMSVGKSWKPRTKSGEALLETNAHYAEVLDTELKEIPVGDLYHSAFNSSEIMPFDAMTLRELGQFLAEECGENDPLASVMKQVQRPKKHVPNLNEMQVEKFLPGVQAVVKTFHELVENNCGKEWSVLRQSYKSVFSYYDKDEDLVPVRAMVFHHILENYKKQKLGS